MVLGVSLVNKVDEERQGIRETVPPSYTTVLGDLAAQAHPHHFGRRSRRLERDVMDTLETEATQADVGRTKGPSVPRRPVRSPLAVCTCVPEDGTRHRRGECKSQVTTRDPRRILGD